MRVGINLLYLIPGIVGGTEIYAQGLLEGLADIASDEEFVVFVNYAAAKWPLPDSSHFLRVVCPITGFNRIQRYFYEQVRLPLLLRRYQVDALHSMGYVGPVFSPVPTILTIHDANFADLRDTIPVWRRIPLHLFSTLAAKRAKVIITVSNFSKTRLVKVLRSPADKIRVIYEAPLVYYSFSKSNDCWLKIKQKYGIREPYLAAFSGGARHKNIWTLIKAVAILRDSLEHNLVLIGQLPPDIKLSVIEERFGLRGHIISTGYVPRAHIWPLLSHAELFVFPSLYEGFGLPVLEAQYAGVPVVCSSAAALPEIAGEGVMFFDPRSAEDLARAVRRVLTSSEVREELVIKGRENVKRFSWHKAAQQTLTVYRSLAGGKK